MPGLTCKYELIKYGNYTFNTFAKVTLNKQNVYSEDGLIVKYVRCTLEVDFILANETVSVTDPVYSGVDAEMDNIHRELQTAGKELKLWYHGMGTEVNVLGKAVTNTVGTNNAPRHIPFNILEGPYPEVVTWEPIAGNNAVRCKWRCVFNMATSPVRMYNQSFDTPEQSTTLSALLGGGGISGPQIQNFARTKAGQQSLDTIINVYINSIFDIAPEQSDPNQMQNFLLSNTEEQEFEVDEDGTAVITLTGEFEFVGSGALMNKLKESPTAIPRLLQILTHYFEPLHPLGFTRTQKYKFKKNKRSIEYTIVDREIKSDNPIMPNIIKADVSHTVSSTLLGGDIFEGSGFLTWGNVFEGTFTVRPGVWKGWSWIAMMTIARQRMARTLPFQNEVNLKTKDALSSAIADTAATGTERKHLLHYIQVKENIYNRDCSFTLKYLVVCNLNTLFESTGLFYPTWIAWQGQNLPTDLGNIPTTVVNGQHVVSNLGQAYADQWKISREYMANAQNVFGYRGPLLPGYDMVFNPYDGWDSNREINTLAPKNPEAKIVLPTTTVSMDTNPANTYTLAERRRNSHLETFSDLGFPNPETAAQPFGGPSPIKEAVGLPSTNFSTSPYKSHDVNNDSSYLKNVSPTQTWLSYNTKFHVRRNENSVMFPSIKPQLPASRMSSSVGSSARAYTGFNINGDSSAEPNTSDYTYDDIQAFGNPLTQIVHTGEALRIGYPIPCPVFIGCKNAGLGSGPGTTLVQAYRIGEAQYTCYQVGKSADLPIFRAVWNVPYVLKGDPSCANISFEANRANYYA